MEIRRISTETKYVTSDGDKFSTRVNALRRQDMLDFTLWYASVEPPADLTNVGMYDWLRANERHLRKWFEAQR